MDLYGVFFGIWFGIGCYRLFTIFAVDAMEEAEGFSPEEAYGMSKAAYTFWSVVSAFGWPVSIPMAYMVSDDEE